MKKQIFTFILITSVCSMLFCKTAKDVEADEYDDSETSSLTSKGSDYSDSKNGFTSGFFNKNEKYLCGNEFTLFEYNAFNQYVQHDAVVTYSTKNQKFGFGSSYLAAYYIVLMDEKNRDLLNKAYQNYLSDFENKKLNRSGKKTYQAYGKISVTLNWGTVKASTPNNGVTKANVGYIFYKNSPYFTIQIPEAYNEYINKSSTAAKTSIALHYAFTKSQAKAMLDNISDSEINKIKPSAVYFEEDVDSYEDETVSENLEAVQKTISTAGTETSDESENQNEISNNPDAEKKSEEVTEITPENNNAQESIQ